MQELCKPVTNLHYTVFTLQKCSPSEYFLSLVLKTSKLAGCFLKDKSAMIQSLALSAVKS